MNNILLKYYVFFLFFFRPPRTQLSARKSRQNTRARPGSHRSAFAFSQQAGIGELLLNRRWLPKINFKKSKSFDVAAASSDGGSI